MENIYRKFKADLVRYYVFHRAERQALRLIKQAKPLPQENLHGYLIIPCDPESVIGSRGDEAMIVALLQSIRSKDAQSPIKMIVRDEKVAESIKNANLDSNLETYPIWNCPYPLPILFDAIEKMQPKEFFVIGADCIDGAYSPYLSLELIAQYAFAARCGIKVHLLGFSYNQNPYTGINKLFHKLSRYGIPFNLREDVSLGRFNRFTGVQGQLVADTAFLLKPDFDSESINEIKRWKAAQDDGSKFIAFNFHPMLRAYASADDVKEDALKVAGQLRVILEKHKEVRLVLLPHDDRKRVTDNHMLAPIHNYLCDRGYGNRIYYNQTVPRSAQLKAIASLMDGVISSRMHLAIASLGMEVPVMVANYQGKFEGLFNHFSLPKDLRLSPSEFCSQQLADRFDYFYENLSMLKETVIKNLPAVIRLAQRNVE